MKLQVFEFIEETLGVLENHDETLRLAKKDLEDFFGERLSSYDFYLNTSGRIKSGESLKEKILRQNLFLKYRTPSNLISNLVDLIGIRIECRFIEDEEKVYRLLKHIFNTTKDGIYFYSPDTPYIQLKIEEPQPQLQHNGFEIYKIDGRYQTDELTVHFETQIKSYVNMFWGDIEHRILYKNFTYFVTEDFIREIMYSIKENLGMIDTQLMVVYHHLNKMETHNIEGTRDQLKAMVSKLIHDIFVIKLKSKTGIALDFRKPTNLIVDYIFAKIYYAGELEVTQYFLKTMNVLSDIRDRDIEFGNYIQLQDCIKFNGEYCEKFGSGIQSVMNLDLKWNLILSIIFEIEGEPRTDEFVNFVEYIVFTIFYRVRSAVKKKVLDPQRQDQVVNEIVDRVFDMICTEYNPDFFSIQNMRILEATVESFLDQEEMSTDGKEPDYKKFREKLMEEVDI